MWAKKSYRGNLKATFALFFERRAPDKRGRRIDSGAFYIRQRGRGGRPPPPSSFWGAAAAAASFWGLAAADQKLTAGFSQRTRSDWAAAKVCHEAALYSAASTRAPF